jgi:hypothetical protein
MRTDKEVLATMREKYAQEARDWEFVLKKGAVKKPDIDRENRMASGIVSMGTPDSEGEVVVPSGGDFSYFPSKIRTVYLGHDYEKPIGRCRRLEVRGNAIYASTYISTTALGEDVLTMMEEEIIEGWSIGFATKAYGPPTTDEIEEYGEHNNIHREWRMFEYSATPMPCHADAKTMLISKVAGLLEKNKIHYSTAEAIDLNPPPRRFFRVTPVMAHDGTMMVPIRRKA